MGEILGLGLTHYPGLMVPDETMGSLVLHTIASGKVPAALRDPAAWPEPMRREWAGAMHALGRRAEIVDWVETYVFNSSKCFAVFPCS